MQQRADEHQRAEEPQDRQSRPTPLPERAEHQADIRTAEARRADREEVRTGDDRTEGRRPTIEPAAEPPRNVTPIGARRDPGDAEAEKHVSAPRMAAEGTSTTHPSLFPTEEAESFRTDWQRVQGAFVDDPKDAIRQADELVSRTITRLSDVFAQERGKLEPRSGEGDTVSTEDLRQALQRYRAFFDRLLSL